MERNFDHIKITPEQLMLYGLQNGSIPLLKYMQWLMTDRSWRSVKDIFTEDIIDKADQQ